MAVSPYAAVCLTAACLMLPSWAQAQGPDSLAALRRAVTATKPLTMVRVELRDSRRLSGALTAAADTSFDLVPNNAQSLRIPYADVTRYWARRRAIAVTAVSAGVFGAVAGSALGLVAGFLAGDLDVDLTPLTGALIFGAVGAASGATLGAVVGAAIPRWSEQWSAGSMVTDTAPSPSPVVISATTAGSPEARRRPRQTGELTLQAEGGYGGYPDAAYDLPSTYGAYWGGSLSLGFRVNRLAFGPELLYVQGPDRIFAANGLVRFDLTNGAGRVTPYAVVGGGFYWWGLDWDDDWYTFSGTLGLGVTMGNRGTWRAEARWHPSLSANQDPWSPTLATVGVGYRVSW